MGRVSLTNKMLVLVVGIITACLVLQTAWSHYIRYGQAENQMLEHAKGIAIEMDAVWDFMEHNQVQFQKNAQGHYRLYCVVVAKSIGRMVTTESNYVIHFTNIQTRRPTDSPDAFELEALQAIAADPGLKEYYGVATDSQGRQVFRYVEPLYYGESCLECHGDPAGELDQLGYEKEGKQVGDLAGAMSIIIPADTYLSNVRMDTLMDVLISVGFVVLAMFAVFLAVRRLVTQPVLRMDQAALEVERGRFDIELPKSRSARDEIDDLAEHFENMARELKTLYTDLESQVDARTMDLIEANEMLEKQRGQLEEAYERLRADSEFTTRFMSIMGHEMRTPLTSILAFVDIWKEKHEPRDAEEAKVVRELEFNGRRLLTIVNNILEKSRIDADRIVMDFGEVELFDLVAQARDDMSPIAQRKSIDFRTHVDRSVPILWADGDKLLMIVENLVSNAIKFTPTGGSVWLDVENAPELAGVKIIVNDTGVGIAEDSLEAVFGSFVQVGDPAARAEGVSGSGLGLAVVKELVELHGGWVKAESELGKGSTFTAFIPEDGSNGRGDA